MRIVILIPTIKPGGAEKQAALLAKNLSLEHEVHFVALYGKRDLSIIVQKYLNDANISVHFYLVNTSINGKSYIYYSNITELKLRLTI